MVQGKDIFTMMNVTSIIYEEDDLIEKLEKALTDYKANKTPKKRKVIVMYSHLLQMKIMNEENGITTVSQAFEDSEKISGIAELAKSMMDGTTDNTD